MTSERDIHISIDGVTFTTLLVSLLDSKFIQSDNNSIVACSNDTSIHIQIKWIAVVEVLSDIFLSG
jgi:hypothetical protein